MFSKLERDHECRVVILSAAGKMFSSGIDLSFYLFALLTVSYLVTSHTVRASQTSFVKSNFQTSESNRKDGMSFLPPKLGAILQT